MENIDEKKGRGRPMEDTYEKWVAGKEEEIEEWCKQGADLNGIAEFLGCGISTLKRIKKRYPKFQELLDRGGEVANETIISSLFKRAKGYEAEETITEVKVSPDGSAQTTYVKKVKKHVPPDTTAAIFWLKNRTKEWRDKQDVQLGTEQPISITIMRDERKRTDKTE